MQQQQEQQQPTQHDEIPASNGFSLARVPTAIEEEEAQSPTRSVEVNGSSDGAQHSSSTAVSDRNPHIRFAQASDVLGNRVGNTVGTSHQSHHTITSTNHDR